MPRGRLAAGTAEGGGAAHVELGLLLQQAQRGLVQRVVDQVLGAARGLARVLLQEVRSARHGLRVIPSALNVYPAPYPEETRDAWVC